jgi:guanylate kinase
MMQADENCVCMDVREDYQVLDIRELNKNLEKGPVLFEGNPFIASVLQTDKRLREVPKRSIFLSPLSLEEIKEIDNKADAPPVADVVAEVMRQKLVRRTEKQKGRLEEKDLESIYLRSKSAWKEIRMAPMFDYVVVNHDGEDSGSWTCAPVLTGEARLATEAVFAGFSGAPHKGLEHWNELPA